jgi:hypothetical protein
MGGHRNYSAIINRLILLKSELPRVKNIKFKDVINELCKYEILEDSDNEEIPDHKKMAVILNYSQNKMNSLLKDLINEFINELSNPPLKITKYVHQIHIHLPYDEWIEKNKELRDRLMHESTWIEMELPFTPGIGDHIEIPIISHTDKNYSGYVHSIRHVLTGTTQEIYLEVHPFHDYYYKWTKMKEDYEHTERWLRSIKNK